MNKSTGGPRKQNSSSVADVEDMVRRAYAQDARPWVIGYSGGKDSTCALQLIWHAISAIPSRDRCKPIFVLSSDTLVETPVIVNYIDEALDKINRAALEQEMPISAQKVVPEVSDSFWVNLIGRGYPAPSRRFRWCTDRLKIDPANAFIKGRVAEFGEVVMVLGVRKAESATRAQVMSLHKIEGTVFSRHSSLPGAYVYTPIESFSTDDVWTYLLQVASPWGADNRQLLALYKNAQAGECPLVVDKNTESCGNSRFGCWVCTVVTKDKAMEAMIDNGEEWLEPLLELRDFLAETQTPDRKSEVRDFRRRNGTVTFVEGREAPIPGPYVMSFREEVLRRLLRAQRDVTLGAPPGEKIVLIQDAELVAIQRVWRREAGDWGETVKQVVREELDRELYIPNESGFEFSESDGSILSDICERHAVPQQLMTELLDIERSMNGLKRRASIHKRIATSLEKEWRNEEEVMAERQRFMETGSLPNRPQ